MTRIAVWAIVAVAARLTVSWASADSGVFADMAQYHERAVHLTTHGTLYPDALRGPGYPAVLALVYSLFGVSFWAARVVNAVIGGGLALLTGVLAQRAGAGDRAWIASAIVAVYPGLVLSSVYLMPEGLYTLLAVLALLLVGYRSFALAVAAGAVTGLAILTRSVGVTLVVTAMVAAEATWWADATAPSTAPGTAVRTWRVAMARLAAFGMACGLVLMPWLAFTSRVAGGPLLDATSGMNVLLGNHDGATGRLDMADEAPLRQAHVAGAASEADANTRALGAGLQWAVDHPEAWLRLGAAKLGYLFGLEGREHAWVYSVGYFGARRPATVTAWGGLLLVSFPVLAVGAALGLARAGGPRPYADGPGTRPPQGSRPDARDLVGANQPVHVALVTLVVATAALHVVSFGESRFHLPLVPVFAVAASLGSGSLGSAGRVRLVVAGAVVAGLALAWVAQAPELLEALSALRAPNGWNAPRPY